MWANGSLKSWKDFGLVQQEQNSVNLPASAIDCEILIVPLLDHVLTKRKSKKWERYRKGGFERIRGGS